MEVSIRATLLLFSIASTVLVVTTGLSAATPPLFPIQDSVLLPEKDDVNLRLPNDTIPIRYDVDLTTRIDAADFSYDGKVDVTISCVVATNTIVMHNRLSEIHSIVMKSGATESELKIFNTDVDTEFLTIQLETPLVVGQTYILSITFTGQHTVDNVGWYRASYTNELGETVWFATTDFGVPDARQAFPCYDEPDKKAVFKFTITNNQIYRAISNMPVSTMIT